MPSRNKTRERYLWRTYGLSRIDWTVIWGYQHGVCGLCLQPILGRSNIDHEHVRGFSKMTPTTRRRYVRGIVHAYPCNKFLIGRHKLGSARQLVAYLEKPPAKMALR